MEQVPTTGSTPEKAEETTEIMKEEPAVQNYSG
jgi:hypothetical protein